MKHSGFHTTYRQALLPNDERVQNYLLSFRSLIAGIVSWRGVAWRGVAWRGVVWCGVVWQMPSVLLLGVAIRCVGMVYFMFRGFWAGREGSPCQDQ